MRALLGLDLNGWHDLAVRDWDPDEPMTRLPTPIVVEGGRAGMVVRLATEDWLGGPQALLAPHGRGPGWGGIGGPDRRRPLADIWSGVLRDEVGVGQPFQAAVAALSRGAQDLVITVPDLPEWNEGPRARLLGLLNRPRGSVRLLWRPVALFLDALANGSIDLSALDQETTILVHGPEGLECQRLTLRRDPNHSDHRAPERAGLGWLEAPAWGLAKLLQRAQTAVESANPGLDWRRIDRPRLAAELLFGEGLPTPELLRHMNGAWVEARPPDVDPEEILGPAEGLRPLPAGALLATPLAPPFAQALLASLAPLAPGIRLVPWACLASGALRAGRLIEAGLPHYFDRLEPIAIAVLEGETPVWKDLIPSNATVPANREYLSEPITGLGWGAGKTSLEVYLRKGPDEVRHWQAERSPGPPSTTPVTLRLRQTPGQSWARLTLAAQDWRPLAHAPLTLDWDSLTPIEMTPAEVLDGLRRKPVIPDTIGDPPHLDLWIGGQWAGSGLLADLTRIEADPVGRAKTLAEHLQQRRIPPGFPGAGMRVYAIGTDGSFPGGLADREKARLLRVLDQLSDHILAAGPRRPLRNNHPLRAVTWSFTLCPEPAQDALIDALEARLAGRAHPITAPAHAFRVVTQGAGRAVRGEDRLRRLFAALRQMQINTDTANGLAMALTRRPEAAQALDADTVVALLQALARSLVWQIEARSFQIRFRNTLSAIAGLFRWRVVSPYGLLCEDDPVARRVHCLLLKADSLIADGAGQINQPDAKRHAISQIRKLLEGEGSADILRQLEDASGLED